MFKKHPKGLLAASLTNMGERFGFYVMMALLTLFLMSKFGMTGAKASIIGSVFYCGIYILALVGGIIADKTRRYKSTIMTGIILMALGYLIIAIPTPTPVTDSSFGLYMSITCIGLFVIAFGNGLFKGNLQALVGQMYDQNPQYADKRDSGFSLFYMFINIGAIFAPLVAVGIRNWWIKANGFLYSAELPELCHEYLGGNMTATKLADFETIARSALIDNNTTLNLDSFANEYLSIFTTGFHYAFAIAIVAMIISLVIFIINKNKFPEPTSTQDIEESIEQKKMDAKEIKQRLYALFAVFAVVVFFWFSFHQNGQSLTLFAKDYTDLSWFKIDALGLEGAELFQAFNPLFVVLLTPLVLALFGWLRSKGKEPSTPKKIGIGMGIAAIGFLVMLVGSLDLPLLNDFKEMTGMQKDDIRVTPFLLIGTYLILTIAELFISPLGLSFVSKVAPPHLQGLMQGCWLGTTAVANLFLFFGALMYQSIPIWMTWGVFALACAFSMIMMLGMVKWLERITEESK